MLFFFKVFSEDECFWIIKQCVQTIPAISVASLQKAELIHNSCVWVTAALISRLTLQK